MKPRSKKINIFHYRNLENGRMLFSRIILREKCLNINVTIRVFTYFKINHALERDGDDMIYLFYDISFFILRNA